MQKRLASLILLIVLFTLQSKAYAYNLNCQFKNKGVEGIHSIKINDESLLLNEDLEIPLEKSRVKCGNFGRQMRLDGSALGFLVVLRSCTSKAVLEGDLIDSIKQVAAEVICHRF